MNMLESWLLKIENRVWGAPLLILLGGVRLYLTLVLRGIQFRYLLYSLGRDDKGAGDISQFQALRLPLAGMIGMEAFENRI